MWSTGYGVIHLACTGSGYIEAKRAGRCEGIVHPIQRARRQRRGRRPYAAKAAMFFHNARHTRTRSTVMARKQRREFVMVSNLVGRISFDVSGGTEGKEDFVPETKGFTIEVTYKDEAEKMGNALNTSVIAVQSILRSFYRKHKRFPFAPGKTQKVNADGEFDLPMVTHIDRLEAAVTAGQVELADKIRVAKAFGLEVPQAWLDELAAAVTMTAATTQSAATATAPTTAPQFKYNKGELSKLATTRLKVLAQQEEFEGYDEMTRAELIEDLARVEKKAS